MNAVMEIKERKISIIIQSWAAHKGMMMLFLKARMYMSALRSTHIYYSSTCALT